MPDALPRMSPSTEPTPPARQVTLRDIAEKLGVSYVTVSLALRDCGRVSTQLRIKVKKVAAEMGYRPDPTARALVEYRLGKRVMSIHAALAWINLWKDPQALRNYKEFDLYWQGAAAAADAAGYRLEEFAVNGDLSLSRLQKILLTRNIRGIIIPPHAIQPDWKEFDWSHFSVVRIGHSVAMPEVAAVAADQVSNTILAFNKIKECGYERIGFVCGRDTSAEPRRWFAGGFLMMQLNEPVKNRIPPLLLEQRNADEDRKKLLAWFKRHKPDAILNEYAPMRSMLESIGCKIPGDVGLATMSVIDGNSDAGIYQNPELIGRAASEFAIALINRNQTGVWPNYRTTTVKGKWVDGKTLPVRK